MNQNRFLGQINTHCITFVNTESQQKKVRVSFSLGLHPSLSCFISLVSSRISIFSNLSPKHIIFFIYNYYIKIVKELYAYMSHSSALFYWPNIFNIFDWIVVILVGFWWSFAFIFLPSTNQVLSLNTERSLQSWRLDGF